ncbi:MAG: transaminase [Dehalococcoidales bacterium]|nr:transaminase [Dehalococcoidales bacterium]
MTPRIQPSRIDQIIQKEEERYILERPGSQALYERAKKSLFHGVPMSWMTEWPGSFPIFVKEARNARLTDVDNHTYVDFCLGDSGSLTGHSPIPTAKAIADQVYKGMTCMLPSEDAIWVGEELTRRFGLPLWQIYTSATDADRFAIKMARKITGRQIVLVFDGCYHGSVDEALVSAKFGSKMAQMREVIGALPNISSRVIQFNDVTELEKALSHRDVACVLTEPAMTNAGIILPNPGFHESLRKITNKYGTLLIIDETHTICAGPGGLTGLWNLKPDFLTIGKSIGGGLPVAAMGMTGEVAKSLQSGKRFGIGVGGTLSGSVLQMAAIKATLGEVLTEKAFEKMISVAERLTDGVNEIIRRNNIPWHVNRIGCRAEYRFVKNPPQNGAESEAVFDEKLDTLLHVFMANRGVLLTPFHTMVLVSPQTTIEDVDIHNQIFAELVDILLS